jgi:ABC-2 type transport system permease protein
MRESSDVLAVICAANPFTHAVEAVRFALYLDVAPFSLAIVAAVLAAAGLLTVISYDPARGYRGGQGSEP